MTQFLHGAEVVQLDGGPRPIRTVSSAVIGLVGSARKGPRNQPVLVRGSLTDALDTFGDEGTIADGVRAILDQTPAAVVCVNVFDPDTHRSDVPADEFKLDGDTVVIAKGAAGLVVKNQAMSTTYQTPADYTFDAATGILTRKGAGNIAAGATISVSYTEADPAAVTPAAVTGEVDGATGAYEGVEALRGAESALGVRPRILCAPGFTGRTTGTAAGGDLAAPTAAALVRVAQRLRAVAVLDGPNSTDAAAADFRALFDSRRAYIVEPHFEVRDTEAGASAAQPPSARVAGVIAATDARRGFWTSPSNQTVHGISGTSRPVDFALDDPTSRANALNAGEIATVIRDAGGFRLWGNRTCASDAKWAFLPVARTADLIADSILRAHRWAVDRGITRNYLEDVAGSVNDYIRELIGLGALVGGRCWPSEANTENALAAGRVYFDYEFTPVSPAERITFRARLTNDYLEEVLP